MESFNSTALRNYSMTHRILSCLTFFLIISMISFIVPYSNLADGQTSFKIYAIDSKPFGHAYAQWSTKFWQWYMSIPTIPGPHPADDPTGAACATSQEGPVWFLAGSAGSQQSRSCVIPYGKAVLVTPIDVECSLAENPTLKTVEDLRSCAATDQDKVNSLRLIIDGTPISNISKYRISSSMFNFTLPENNILGLEPQITQSVSDGYWIILEPLAKGNHTIISTGAAIDPTGVYSFASDVSWKITIK
jgi:hypothetical protein